MKSVIVWVCSDGPQDHAKQGGVALRGLTFTHNDWPVRLSVHVYGNLGAMTNAINGIIRKAEKHGCKFDKVWKCKATAHSIQTSLLDRIDGRRRSTVMLGFHEGNVNPPTITHEAVHAAEYFASRLGRGKHIGPKRNRTLATRTLWWGEWRAFCAEAIVATITAWIDNDYEWKDEFQHDFWPKLRG